MSAERIEKTILNLINSKFKLYIEHSKFDDKEEECATSFIELLAIAEIAKASDSGLSLDCQKEISEVVDKALNYIDTIEKRLEISHE